MKRQLENELVNMISQYVDVNALEEIKLKITMVLNEYHIDQEEHSLVVYEQDETALAIKKFIAAKIAKGCTPKTIFFYRTSIKKVLLTIGKPYNQVTADDVRYYLAKRVQVDGVSKTTANNERRALSSFYQWLQQEEIITKNPMAKIEAIKETKKKKKAFSKMELERLRAACRCTRETAIVEVLISTWARVSEVAQIKLSDIEGETIAVHGKGDKDRNVYLTAKAQLAVNKYLADRNDDNPYLFPKAKYAGDIAQMSKGRRRRNACMWYADKDLVDETHCSDKGTIEAIVRNIGRRAGVENTHPHRFRRTGATLALQSGMPLLQVSKMLGHEQIGTTQIYLDITDEDLMRAHERYVI